MSHAGAKDEYNSIEGLLAPVREGALRPLSGRYLMALAAGQGSLMWSLLVLGIDTTSIFDTSSSPFFVVCSSVSCPQYDLSRLSHLKSGGGKLQRRHDLPEDAFYLPADNEVAKVRTEWQKFFFIALSYRWLSQVHGGVVESCVSTVEQPVSSSA